MKRVSHSVLIVILLVGMAGQEQPSATHAETCPRDCTPCQQAGDKALQFIVSRQGKDGSWILDEKKYGRHRLPMTTFCGLALIAAGTTLNSGPYQKELLKAKQVVEDAVPQILKGKTPYSFRDNYGVQMDQLPMAGVFLAHLYHLEKSDTRKKLLEGIRDFLAKEQLKDGGWTYDKYMYKMKMGNGMSYLSNEVLISLFALRTVGIDTDGSVFQRASEMYARKEMQVADGSLNYFVHYNSGNAALRVGRTLEALWPMHLMGMTKTETYTKAKEFSDKNFADLDRAQHGPTYHLFYGGLACMYGEDKTWWPRFYKQYRDIILKAQQENGSFAVKPRDGTFDSVDKYFGTMYSTTLTTTVLLLPRGHLMFDKLTPLPSPQK